MPTTGFHYVYILRDVATGQHHYTGVTQNLQERLVYHNSGHVPHTSKYAPWYIETAIAFRDKQKAYAYERYLKTGAGRAYATRHFCPKLLAPSAANGHSDIWRNESYPPHE